MTEGRDEGDSDLWRREKKEKRELKRKVVFSAECLSIDSGSIKRLD